MKRLKKLGYFRELINGYFIGPKIREAIQSQKQPYEDEIVEYLRHGHVVMYKMSYAIDVISHELLPYGSHKCTDGVWIWPGELEYYVRTYHVKVSDDFVKHAQSNQWVVPAMSTELLVAIAKKMTFPPW